MFIINIFVCEASSQPKKSWLLIEQFQLALASSSWMTMQIGASISDWNV